ncbi:MAG TPA: radical SAM protein [Thermoanaerobaculia bacterium]|jgi:MoaA/NifB/PqqE/SkfB family radical SAM enzyme|nr:radical SAM protein [Thermoanaerobaculia bacterium]
MGRPLHVILDVTARCNLKCVMCYFSETDRLHFPPEDVPTPSDGNMPLSVFERVAAELFPRSHKVALGCAAEPMIHPQFREILDVAGRYGVPDLWFPTNLLALSESTAQALIRNRVSTVAASIDGTTPETYEKIRVPARWEQLLSRLELLREAKKRSRTDRPRLRIIFTWMKSNRQELASLPAFAEEVGASELDVRYVCPTVGVDVTPELLSGEDPTRLNAELGSAAREAVSRGLRLVSYPDFESGQPRPRDLASRVRRRLWRIRAGIDRPEHLRYMWNQKWNGCAYPGDYYVVRPNGAVAPCIYWDREPIGFFPAQGLAEISGGAPLKRIRTGLRSEEAYGTCASCGERRSALYGAKLPAKAAREAKLFRA